MDYILSSDPCYYTNQFWTIKKTMYYSKILSTETEIKLVDVILRFLIKKRNYIKMKSRFSFSNFVLSQVFKVDLCSAFASAYTHTHTDIYTRNRCNPKVNITQTTIKCTYFMSHTRNQYFFWFDSIMNLQEIIFLLGRTLKKISDMTLFLHFC